MKRAFLTIGGLSVLLGSQAGCIRVAALPVAPEVGEGGVARPLDGGSRLTAACQDAEVPRDRASACLALASYFEEGIFGLPRDPHRAAMLRATAVDTLQASCDLGDVSDCTRAASAIGTELRGGNASPLAADAAMWMERYAEDGCRGGDAPGCALLGLMYERGEVVPRDLARSTGYFSRACDAGHRRSCLHLAERAEGPSARRAYERACDAGSGYGCAVAGQLHRRGDGAVPGVDRVVYFARGCAMGDPASCLLGAETYRGDDLAYQRGAASFASTGCQQGIPDACFVAGEMLRRGEGVRKDEHAARRAYRRACEAGLEKACDALRPGGRKPPWSEFAREGPAEVEMD